MDGRKCITGSRTTLVLYRACLAPYHDGYRNAWLKRRTPSRISCLVQAGELIQADSPSVWKDEPVKRDSQP